MANSILRGALFAALRLWAGAFLRVAAVGFDLLNRGHAGLPRNWVRFARRGSRFRPDAAVDSQFGPGSSLSFQPQHARLVDWLKTCFCPPVRFLARALQFAMLSPAQRDREFVTDLEADATGLRETQMMGIVRLASADEAGLFRDEPQMRLVTQPPRTGIASTLLSMRPRITSF